MKHQKLFLIAVVMFFIFSGLIVQANVLFAADRQADSSSVYVPETDDEIDTDNQMNEQEDINTYDSEDQDADEDIYIEMAPDQQLDEETDEEPVYDVGSELEEAPESEDTQE